MTSKEAFKEIIKVCNYYHRQISKVDCDSICGYPIKNIEKDLEVLELIKNNKIIFLMAIFNERNSYCGQSNVEVERAKDYQKELSKIKEWLENDK